MTGGFLECAGKKYQFGFQLRLIAIKELRGNADILNFSSFSTRVHLHSKSFCFSAFALIFMSCVVTNYLVLLQLLYTSAIFASLVRM